MDESFQHRLKITAKRIEAALDGLLSNHAAAHETARPERLVRAMRHGTLSGGKRLRPFLLTETASLFDVDPSVALDAACALECVHCYSLIHDDLPAMDDDDLRRGKPTVHKAFDEATAILAGDALLTLAFELLAGTRGGDDNSLAAETRISLISALSRAAGPGGMIGGQVLDIAAETSPPDEVGIKLLQSMKTGALIRYACEAGAIIGKADESQMSNLMRFGEIIGLAFQLADDLLDVTESSGTVGKATGKDAALGKATLVGLYGVDATRSLLDDILQQADDTLSPFGPRAEMLRQTARFIINRQH